MIPSTTSSNTPWGKSLLTWGFLCVSLLFTPVLSSQELTNLPHLRIAAQQQQEQRTLQDEVVRTDLVKLIPFDVQIALSFEDEAEIEELNVGALTDVITDWMSESFDVKATTQLLEEQANTTYFESIALELVNQKLQTSQQNANGKIALLTTSYDGVSLWERIGSSTPPMDPDLVELMQRATFLEDNALLELLQSSTGQIGIQQEEMLLDVRAYITPPNTDTGGDNDEEVPTNDSGNNNNQNLEIIIIIAIVVACLAFGLLIFAVVWAWKSDKKGGSSSVGNKSSRFSKNSNDNKGSTNTKRQASKKSFGSTDKKKSTSSKTTPAIGKKKGGNNSEEVSEHNGDAAATGQKATRNSNHNKNSATENGNTNDPYNYPESIVSEDISTSLTAYYKSGMMPYSSGGNGRGLSGNDLNDAASMSSMDSYGYSLDGYAPSLGTAQGGYPVGPLQAAKDAPVTVGDEDVDDKYAASAVQDEEVEDYEAQA